METDWVLTWPTEVPYGKHQNSPPDCPSFQRLSSWTSSVFWERIHYRTYCSCRGPGSSSFPCQASYHHEALLQSIRSMTSYDESNSASPENKTKISSATKYWNLWGLDLFVISVVGKPFHYEIVDSIKRCLLIRGVLYGHGYEGNVWVGRLHHVLGGGVLRDSVVGTVRWPHVPKNESIWLVSCEGTEQVTEQKQTFCC